MRIKHQLLLIIITITLFGCQNDDAIGDLAETLALDENFIENVRIDLQIKDKILSNEIEFPEERRKGIKPASEFSSIEEYVEQYNQPGFKGFDIYKKLSLDKLNSFNAAIRSHSELEEMSPQEIQQTLSKARKIVESNL
jgi:hypothetical protein